MGAVAAGTVVAVVVTAASLPLVLRLLERGEVRDVANERSAHVGAVTRGAGVSVMAGAVAGALVGHDQLGDLALPFLGTCAAFAAVGLADDVRSRPPALRLAAQVVLAALGVAGVLWAAATTPSWWSPALAPVAVVFVAGFVNAFNFMDGVNGISGGTAIVAGLSLAAAGALDDQPVLALLGLTMAAAMAGFLPSNVPTARAFLGDVGSYGAGAWLALAALVAALVTGSVAVAVAPLVIYVADTGWTLARRARRHARLLSPHRDHAYQQLDELGWPHVAVAAYVAGAGAVTAAAALTAFAVGGPVAHAVAAVVVAVVVVGYLATPAAVRARRSSVPGATG